MKKCEHCGSENTDDAARCRVCCTEFGRGPAAGEGNLAEPEGGGSFERIVTLDNEVEAGLVDAVLLERKIPHIMQSYHDSAYDGLFQMQRGWGVVLAPPGRKAEVLAVIEDIRSQSSSSGTTNGPSQ